MLKFVLLIALPVVVREIALWVTAKGAPKGKRIGGNPSVIIWFVSYIALLGLVIRRLQITPPSTMGWVGYALLWMGVFLRIAAHRELKTFFSSSIVIRDGHRVIESGPYRYLRHPLHIGLLLEIAGLGLLSSSWYAALIFIVSFLVHIVRSKNEERLLVEHLGEAYRKYLRSAWDPIDIIPRLRKDL